MHFRAVPFSSKDDSFLVKYLAYYKPDHRGRMGNKVYEVLTDDVRSLSLIMLLII